MTHRERFSLRLLTPNGTSAEEREKQAAIDREGEERASLEIYLEGARDWRLENRGTVLVRRAQMPTEGAAKLVSLRLLSLALEERLSHQLRRDGRQIELRLPLRTQPAVTVEIVEACEAIVQRSTLDDAN